MLRTDAPTAQTKASPMPRQTGNRSLQLSEKHIATGFRYRGPDDHSPASADGRRLPGGSELGTADPGAVSVSVKIKQDLIAISRCIWYNHARHHREVLLLKILKYILWIFAGFLISFAVVIGALWLYLPQARWSAPSTENRAALIQSAQSRLGIEEGTEAHHAIIDNYNNHEPLAQGYEVKYEDDWCATFVSFAAIDANLTDFIPTECSCERQIGLWMELDRWEEQDSYLPQSGDIIYYDWDVRTLGNSTGWSDHVGIVVGTFGPFIKIIEGNKDDAVGYRYIIRWDPRIRGYGLPNC